MWFVDGASVCNRYGGGNWDTFRIWCDRLLQGASGFRTKIQNMGFIYARGMYVPYASLEANHAYRSEDMAVRGQVWGKIV